jgi:hypothetical protein
LVELTDGFVTQSVKPTGLGTRGAR